MNNKFIVYVSLPCAIIACGYALRANSTELAQKDNGYDSVVAYIVPAVTAFRSRLSGSDIQDVACKVTGGMASANYIHNVVISSIVQPVTGEDVQSEFRFTGMRIKIDFFKAGVLKQEVFFADSIDSRPTLPGKIDGRLILFNHALPTYVRSWASTPTLPKTYPGTVGSC